jgi:hypothetical protein
LPEEFGACNAKDRVCRGGACVRAELAVVDGVGTAMSLGCM